MNDSGGAKNSYRFSLKGMVGRVKDEFHYYTKRPWTLEEAGKFWDSISEYDEVNETIYPYWRRFTNSFELAIKHLNRDNYETLDIQCRSGYGSLFWYEKGKVKKSVCADFSDNFLSQTEKRLSESGLEFDIVKIKELPLPFEDGEFNLVCSYETIEHVYDYRFFFGELMRVLKKDGILILTCPNRMWEWVHWLSAVININHSEGPHRFLKRKELTSCFKHENAILLEENSTIIFPFNNQISIKLDRFLERILPEIFKSLFALRRTFVLGHGES